MKENIAKQTFGNLFVMECINKSLFRLKLVIQHFMKKNIFKIIFLLLVVNSHAQLKIKTTLYGEDGGYIKVLVNGKLPYRTNYNGSFSTELTKKLNRILILESWISIEIINIPKDVKTNLGSIEIPMRKSVEIREYNNFTEDEKKNLQAVHHNIQLLGYEYRDRLENSKLTFTCNNIKFELDKFKFDVKKQKVIIDFKDLKPCAY